MQRGTIVPQHHVMGRPSRLGVDNFNPRRRKAAEQLEMLSTGEGTVIPTNTLAKLRRDMERLQLVVAQIKAVEEIRLKRLEQAMRHRF